VALGASRPRWRGGTGCSLLTFPAPWGGPGRVQTGRIAPWRRKSISYVVPRNPLGATTQCHIFMILLQRQGVYLNKTTRWHLWASLSKPSLLERILFWIGRLFLPISHHNSDTMYKSAFAYGSLFLLAAMVAGFACREVAGRYPPPCQAKPVCLAFSQRDDAPSASPVTYLLTTSGPTQWTPYQPISPSTSFRNSLVFPPQQ